MALIVARTAFVPLALRGFLGLMVALVPAGAVLLKLDQESRTARETQEIDQVTSLLQRVATQQAATFGAARQILSAMAATPILAGRECATFLHRALEANPRYLNAVLSDANGRVICTTRASAPPDPGLLAVLRGEGFQVSSYQAGVAPAGGTLSLAQPLRDASGRLVGAAAVTLSLDWLAEDLGAMGLPPLAIATIADRNGIVLASSRRTETLVGSQLSGLAHRFLDAAAAGVVAATGEEGLRRLAYVPAHEGPGGLFVAVGLRQDKADGADVALDTALMIVGGLLLSFLIGLAVFHAAAEGPVQALLGAARRWGAQDWSARVGRIGGGRDFRRLAGAFDSMAQTVEAQQRAEARWQACMETAPLFVLAADHAGRVEWVNLRWRDATGLDLNESRGDGWLEAIAPADRLSFEAVWYAAVGDPEGPSLIREVTLRSGHRCLFTGAPAVSDKKEVLAWALFGIDVRDRLRAEARAEESDAQLHAVYAHAPVGLCLLDRNLRFLAVNGRLARAHGRPASEHPGRSLAEMAPDFAAELEERLREVVATGNALEDIEVSTHLDGDQRHWLCSYHAVRDHSGAVATISGAVVDITARRRMEDSARQLSREVDHRAQNALSVVRGLLRLSAADAPDDVPALVEELEGRIGAISRAHDVLSRENWLGADLGEIVIRELAAHPGRIEASGPPIGLVAEGAQPLALALHELVSNALRHGALSDESGQVVITWMRTDKGAELHWTESGGPPLAGPPARTGFGTMLIDANMRTQLAGDIHRQWATEGLSCVLEIGAEALAPDHSRGRLEGKPLAGRSVLLLEDVPSPDISIAAALREGGCRVLGPARSVAEAIFLAGQAGRVDVVLIAGRLAEHQDERLGEILRQRARLVLRLSPELLKGRPMTPQGVRQVLAGALASTSSG
ncbi:sensor histidine kinase [Roseococcus pinisoli]|uniref:histidine kinase n=1 Tax=Roseococcus pinisoli TaxID=2835040 RepID=A0ABS5QEZ4_9PROT|nr:PAS domain-containing protein [Roseococcus pinisoli]MBS7812139.1 PAS domain-containing protein [Roseococcus pinisoli]